MSDKELAEMKARWSCEFGQMVGQRLVVDQAPMRLLIDRCIAEIQRQRAEIERLHQLLDYALSQTADVDVFSRAVQDLPGNFTAEDREGGD